MSRNPTVLARTLLASAMMLTTILAGSTAAQAATTPAAASAFTQIRNAQTGLCIQPLTNGESLLAQRACNPTNLAQRWIVVPKNNGNHIVNQASGLCMYMDGPVAHNSPVIQAGCTTVTNEDWYLSFSPPSVTTIESKADHEYTNLCLAPQSTAVGARLKVRQCGGGIQNWVVGV